MTGEQPRRATQPLAWVSVGRKASAVHEPICYGQGDNCVLLRSKLLSIEKLIRPTRISIMDCPHCGGPSPDGSKFCAYCGKEMTAAKAAGPQSGPMIPQGPPPGNGLPPQYAYLPHEQWMQTQPEPLTSQQKIVKYFLHGVAFSILNLALIILWVILAVGLVIIGLCFGVIVAIVVLFLLYGFLNTFITEHIWKVKLKRNLSSIFLHGMVLFFVILIANIPSILAQTAAPGVLTSVVIFIVYCFVDGFLARKVAQFWEIKSMPFPPAQNPPQYTP